MISSSRERWTGTCVQAISPLSSLSIRRADVDADRLPKPDVDHLAFDFEPRMVGRLLARSAARGEEQQGGDGAFHGAAPVLSERQVPNRQARLSQSRSNAHDGVALRSGTTMRGATVQAIETRVLRVAPIFDLVPFASRRHTRERPWSLA